MSKIYEAVEGLHIDVALTDSEGESVAHTRIAAAHFYVFRPGGLVEEIWPVTTLEPNILRHTVPEDAEILPGKYKIQPYIETVDGYKGRTEPFIVIVHKKMRA